MKPRTPLARALIYVLLLLGSVIFASPLVWLISTSLKPIEQTQTSPPTWLPRAYHATVNGQKMEVTRDYEVAPGEWHVTEYSSERVRRHDLASAIVPSSQIETTIRPRWENYPTALATIGGANIEQTQKNPSSSTEAENGEDAHVSFWRIVANTLIVCCLGAVGAVLSNALVAYSFAKIRWRGRDTFFAVSLASMMVPFPVLMVPLYGVFRNLGWIGTLYPLWVPAFFGHAFNIFLMRQFFMTIPEELSEAARLDGCNDLRILWHVILPLSRPVIAVVALFHFLYNWNDFMAPLLYLTRRHTFTLALALQSYQSQMGGVQWHHLMAASAVVILPVVVLYFLAQKTFIAGIATTGIKG